MRIAILKSSLPRHRPQTRCVASKSIGMSMASAPIDLVAWIKDNGGKVEGVTVANLAGTDGGSGWGLKSVNSTSPGTKLLDLPLRCQLTYSSSDDPKLLKLIEEVPSELWGGKLALQLLSHRLQGGGSNLGCYISNLPIGFPGIPMFFPREAIAAIEYPPVTEQVKKRCKWLYEFSTQTLSKLPGSPSDPFYGTNIDINAMGWALACVTSRAFRTKGPQYPASCLPLIDMANHSFDPNVEVRQTDLGIGLFAKKQLTAGEPLLLSYGPLTNDFLFMDYGFIIQDNPYDRVQLRFGVDLIQAGAMVAGVTSSNGEPLELKPQSWQRSLLTQMKLEGPDANTEVTFGGPQHVDNRLLAAARILMAQSQEEIQDRTTERLGKLDQPVNRTNERKALRALSGVAAYSLSRFSTSADQDEEMLITGKMVQTEQDKSTSAGSATPLNIPLTDELRLAVRFRLEKKRILSAAIQTMGRQLQNLPKAATPESNTASKKGQGPIAATNKGFGKSSKSS